MARILGNIDRKELAATGLHKTLHKTLHPLTLKMAQTLVPTKECNMGVRKMSVFEIGFAKLNKVTVLGDSRLSVNIHIWSGTYTYKLYDIVYLK